MPDAAYFLTLARYHQWATERLLDTVQQVSEDDYRRDIGLFFHSLHGTLNHLLAVEHQLWWPRLTSGQSPQMQLNGIVYESRVTLDAQLRRLSARWEPWIQSVDAARWSGDLCYTTLRGSQVCLPLSTTLTHVFNHGTHHRGQITAVLTQLGLRCPEMDLIYYLQEREALPPAPTTT